MPSILKAASVKIDNEKRVNIEVGSALYQFVEEPEPESITLESQEEKARAIVQKAKKEAEQLIENANREAKKAAEDIKAKAEEEANQIKEQAQQSGYQEGQRKAAADSAATLQKANVTLNEAKRDRAAAEASLEPDMVNLVSQIVNKLLGSIIEINPSVIVNLIKQGIANATITGKVFIRVSPYDFETVTENKESLLAATDGSVSLEIIKDLSLDHMDCVIETPFGNIDCSLTQQFEALRNNLAYILQNR